VIGRLGEWVNVVLIGYRGAGKTVVGRQLATRLGMKFVDTDVLIEERHQKRISDIVMSEGWDHFRKLERQLIQEVSIQDHLVIASGGGVVLDVNNIIALRKKGFIIWLKAEPEVLLKRMGEDPQTAIQRPPLTEKGALEEIKEVLAYRNPFYKWASGAQLDTTTFDVEAVVENILFILKGKV
jgi:shikimate kinase